MTPEAILQIAPTMLDFGVMEEKKQSEHHGRATLTITNSGDRVLVGSITLQVAWLTVDKTDFRLEPGKSSEHTFSMTALSPAVWTSHRFGSDFIALVTSNGGSETIGGYYFFREEQVLKKARIRTFQKSTLFFALGAACVILLGLQGVTNFLSSTESQRRTQMMEEVLQTATEVKSQQLTASAPTPTLIFGLGDPDSFNATAAAVGESLISNITNNAEPTFTPWPASKYPSPQQFLFTYYTHLNEGNFNEAWWLLSENMQRTCCSTGGGTPIENYRALMNDIKSFELVSAYLQAEEVNPAEVRFELIQYNKDGTQDDSVYTAYIIDDGERNTLLIDEIK